MQNEIWHRNVFICHLKIYKLVPRSQHSRQTVPHLSPYKVVVCGTDSWQVSERRWERPVYICCRRLVVVGEIRRRHTMNKFEHHNIGLEYDPASKHSMERSILLLSADVTRVARGSKFQDPTRPAGPSDPRTTLDVTHRQTAGADKSLRVDILG